MRISVVLPEPLGPSRPKISPCPMCEILHRLARAELLGQVLDDDRIGHRPTLPLPGTLGPAAGVISMARSPLGRCRLPSPTVASGTVSTTEIGETARLRAVGMLRQPGRLRHTTPSPDVPGSSARHRCSAQRNSLHSLQGRIPTCG